MAEHERSEVSLSPLDMLMPRFHVPKLLYFASTSEPETVSSGLRAALALTIRAIPVIGASVALCRNDSDQKGALSVQSPYFSADHILSSNDLREEYDYEKLRAANFPTDAINLDKMAPELFAKPGDSVPVMLAQINFMQGGLLLFFAIHHCVMDEVGIFNVMRVWSTSCRGDASIDFVTPEWLDRQPLMQGSGLGRLQDHPEYTLSPEGAATQATEDPSAFYPQCSDVKTAVFFFSDESLDRLKETATKKIAEMTEMSKQDIPWISTNDALMGFLWSSVTKARVARSIGATADIFPRFGMTMNARSHLSPPMSQDYCGNLVLIAKTFTNAQNLVCEYPESLANAASLIRKSIHVIDHQYIKDVIQLVNSTKDLGRLAPRRRSAVEHSLGCSSWARQPYYSLDWGNAMGRRCERVRWRSLKTDGLFIIFPRVPLSNGSNTPSEAANDGGLEIVLGLKTHVMEHLLKDRIFCSFAKWRCS